MSACFWRSAKRASRNRTGQWDHVRQGGEVNTIMLKTFVVAALTGSVSKAAKELRYCESTVSYHIREVEKVCRAPLFDRETRGFTLTRSGRKALELAQRMLPLSEQLSEVSKGPRRPRQSALHGTRPRGSATTGFPGIPIG